MTPPDKAKKLGGIVRICVRHQMEACVAVWPGQVRVEGRSAVKTTSRASFTCAAGMRGLWTGSAALVVLLLAIVLMNLACAAPEAELVQTLKTTQDLHTRQTAAGDLAKLCSVSATRDLVAAAQTDQSASAGLQALRDAYIETLAVPPEKKPSEERIAVIAGSIDCLAAIGDEASAEALGAFATSQTSYAVDLRIKAANALGFFPSSASSTPLVHIMSISSGQQDSLQLRQVASGFLMLRPESASELIAARVAAEADEGVCSLIDDTLVGMGEPAAEAIASELTRRSWVAEILYKMGAPAIAALSHQLDNGTDMVRYSALGVLLRLWLDGLTQDVASHLVNGVRVPLLVDARSHAGYADERDGAIESILGEIGAPAVGPLVAQLGAASWVDGVLSSLGAVAAPQLLATVQGADAQQRDRALGVLLDFYSRDHEQAERFLATPDMVGVLIAARSEAGYNESRNSGIDNILVQIGEPAVGPLIAQVDKAEWAGVVLGRTGALAAPQLLQAYENANPPASYTLFGVFLDCYWHDLGGSKEFVVEPGLVPALIDARGQAGYEATRNSIIETILVGVGKPAVAPLAAQLGKNDWVDSLLAVFGDVAAPQLSKALESDDPQTSIHALWALLEMSESAPDVAQPILSKHLSVVVTARTDPSCSGAAASTIDSLLRELGVPAAGALLTAGASLLTDEAEWTDVGRARTIYNLIGSFDAQTAIDAIVDRVSHSGANRLHLLFLAVKLGISGSEERLNQLLYDHGTKSMAEDYLNCGSEALDEGGRKWASMHGYYVSTGEGSHRTAWGAF
jgi:hypothetical protein